jgi:hypothetical protein
LACRRSSRVEERMNGGTRIFVKVCGVVVGAGIVAIYLLAPQVWRLLCSAMASIGG